MKITVKTSTPLAKYLPATASSNSAKLQLPDKATALDVVTHLGMPAQTNYLITLNSAMVPMSKRATTTLCDGDELSILPPLKGG